MYDSDPLSEVKDSFCQVMDSTISQHCPWLRRVGLATVNALPGELPS